MKNITVKFPDENLVIGVPLGTLLSDAVSEAGFRIPSECGGGGRCGKCKVIVDGLVSDLSGAEERLLDEKETSAGVRLACMTYLEGNTSVKFQGPTVSGKISAFPLGYIRVDGGDFAPALEKSGLNLAPAGPSDRRSDLRRLADSLPGQRMDVPVEVIRELPIIIRKNDFQTEIVSDAGNVISIFPPGEKRLLGAAVDIGTTTLCARLADIESGEILASSVMLNPQRLYGADVASRITYTVSGRGGLGTLRSLVVESINRLILETAARAGVRADDIFKFVVAGNSTMTHIFLGVDVSAIAVAPYISPTSGMLRYRAGELGLISAPGAVVQVLPAVAAYVGSDAVAAALRVRLPRQGRPAVVMDLGTNAEIVLTDGENYYACSAAAGPALEGAHIQHGMMAAAGAICRVEIGDEMRIETIGGAPPEGLCGTGLLDSISESLKAGLISKDGRIAVAGETGVAMPVSGDGGNRRIIIYDPPENGSGRQVVLTQKDVRQFQLAKGAIRTGLDLLLERAGVNPQDLETIYLAGALGTSIRPESAAGAGIVPGIPLERIKFAGNAALDGATEALLSRSFVESVSDFSSAVKYLELSAMKEFTDAFVERLGF